MLHASPLWKHNTAMNYTPVGFACLCVLLQASSSGQLPYLCYKWSACFGLFLLYAVQAISFDRKSVSLAITGIECSPLITSVLDLIQWFSKDSRRTLEMHAREIPWHSIH